jgi:hypothetical protein
MDAFREAAYRRWSRAGLDHAACGAGRARAKADPRRAVAPVDGGALRDLVATVAADARLVRVPVNQPPWTSTGLVVSNRQPYCALPQVKPQMDAAVLVCV